MTTLIAADNHIALFALLCAICALVIYLEQKICLGSKNYRMYYGTIDYISVIKSKGNTGKRRSV